MSKRNLDFEKCFWLPILSFQTIGFDFREHQRANWKKYAAKVLAVFSILSHIFVYSHIIAQFPALDFHRNMHVIMATASFVAFAINGNVKFLAFLTNRKRIRMIYEFLQEIYPNTQKEHHAYRAERYYYTWKELTATISFMANCGLLAAVPLFQSIVQFIYDIHHKGYAESHFKYLRFYNPVYFIDHRRPLNYIFIYIIESATCFYLILTNLGTDLWLIPFATQLCMHLDKISRDLKTLKPRENNIKADLMRIKNIVRKHQCIMKQHSELNKTLEIAMAFNLISVGGLICTVGMQLCVGGITPDLCLLFVYFCCSILQLYIVCHRGQQLSDASENIGLAAYTGAWYNGIPKYRKFLLILMMRANKLANLNVVGGPPISVDTFKIVLTASYRCFAVFYEMVDKNDA